jgi:hypothetical protein
VALASSLISDAYRESNLVPLVGTLTTAEQAEGLRLLNNLVLSVMGNEVGQALTDIQIGGGFDQAGLCNPWVPENARLIVEQSQGISLHPQPYDGQRLGVAGDFSGDSMTISANGRKIENTATITLSADGIARQWLYRADLGNWTRVSELVASDTFPFPQEFDDFFIVSLALRINPRHRQAMAGESAEALKRGRDQIRARYRKRRAPNEPILGLMGQSGGGGTFNPLRA